MRILQLCNKMPWPPDDGGRIAMLNMAKGFASNNIEVFNLSMSTKKHRTHLSEIPKSLSEKIKFRIVNVPAKITPQGALINLLFSSKPYTATRFVSKEFGRNLVELLEKNSFDIVQIEGLYLLYYIPLIRKHSSAIISYRAHNIEFEIWDRISQNSKSLLRRFYYRNLTERLRTYEINVINQYDALVPITEKDAEVFVESGNIRPVFVSQTGVDLSDIQRVKKECIQDSLFNIGALDWPPNQEGLMWFIKNIWPMIHKEIENSTFHIAGRNAPEWIVKIFNQTDGIKYSGEVPDAFEFMSDKKIMVVPLLSGSGMRIKIIEGMVLGKCIVSTTVAKEGISVEDGKNIIVEDNPDKFALKIIELLKDNQQLETIGKNAHEYIIEHFDNEKLSKALIEFYKSLINKNNID